MLELVLLLISVLLVVLCGLFAAAEFSLLTVNRSTVEHFAKRGDESAKAIAAALRTLSSQLSGAQVGISLTTLAIGFLAEPSIARLLAEPLRASGLPEGVVSKLAIVLGVSLATAVTMLYGELAPKNLAISKPMATARFIVRPQRLFTLIMRGPIRLLNASANYIVRQFGVRPQEELASARSADELLALVRRSAEKGTLPKETAIMMERSLNFSDLTALDVMTPRLRMKALTSDQPVQSVIDLTRKTGLSRFPVLGENHDDIVGVVHVKNALAVPRTDRAGINISQIMRQAAFVPSSLQLDPLLDQLRQGGMQMAIVIDEFGGTDGIVTMEDLLEELVGEVEDEHDRQRASIRKLRNGSFILSGLLRPDEVGEDAGIYLPDKEEYETVGGLVAHYLERLPDVHDSVEVPAVDREGRDLTATIRVERMDGHRVDRVRMILSPRSIEEKKL